MASFWRVACQAIASPAKRKAAANSVAIRDTRSRRIAPVRVAHDPRHVVGSPQHPLPAGRALGRDRGGHHGDRRHDGGEEDEVDDRGTAPTRSS